MSMDRYEPRETRYDGWFGRLCKTIPLFDVRAPGDWIVEYRSFRLTIWEHTTTGVVLECGRNADGWRVTVHDPETNRRYPALPRNASRWKAFEAARQFLEGEDPLMVDRDAEFGDDFEGVLILENVIDSR